MAVEIPVVIDIDKAFEDAAKRVDSAIKPLQKSLSDESLSIEIELDSKGGKATVKDFVDGSIKEIDKFRKAISQIKTEIQNMSLAGTFDANVGRGAALQEALLALSKIKKTAEDAANAPLKALRTQERVNSKLQEEDEYLESIAGTIAGIQNKLDAVKEDLEYTKIDSPQFGEVAKKFHEITEEMEQAQQKLAEFGTKAGSLDNLNLKIGELEKSWNAMPYSKMIDANGKITTEAQKIIVEYTKVTNQIEKQKNILNSILEKQRKIREQQQKKEAEEERAIENAIREEEELKKHKEALDMDAKSMNDLNTKLAAWKKEMDSTDLHSEKWTEAANEVSALSREIQITSEYLANLGLKAGSIDSINAKIQQLNKEWNAMSASEKYVNGDASKGMTERARALVSMYKQQTQELKEQSMSLEQIAQKEQKRIELINKGAQRRRYENAILNSSVKTMRILQEQERILSDRLSRTKIGSDKYKQLEDQLRRVRLEMQQTTNVVKSDTKSLNAELGESNSRLATLIKNSIRLVAIHSATRFVRNIREVTAQFELQKVALGSIIQDAEKANSLFKQIKAAAVESPFEIKDLVTYTKQLSAYQIETDKLFDTTMKLADISSGLGVDMGRLILAFGQVRAAAVLRGQELRQFTEAGIPLVDKLAQKFSELNGRAVSTAEVFELISKRAVPFSMIEDIFNDLTSAGGAFYKMQEKQAETLLGQWNNLKDSISIMYDEIGNTSVVHGAMETVISDAKKIMQNWRQVADIIKFVGVQFGVMKFASLFLPTLTRNTKLLEKAELAEARAKQISNSAHNNKILQASSNSLRAYTYYMILASRATTGFSRAINIAKATISGNWMSILLAAIGLLISKLISAKNEANRLNKELSKISSEGAIKIEQSIRNFERLARSATNAADGSKEQKNAIDELIRTYGDILPPSDKLIDKLKEMKGNYTSLTDAIREKINIQLKEQKVDEITSEYGAKIGNKRDTLKKYLKEKGLSSEEISTVLSQLQTAVENGLVGVEQDVLSQAKAIEKIIYNYTGKYVKLTESVYSKIAGAGNKTIYHGEKATKLTNTFSSLVELYSGMNLKIKEVESEMNGQIGVIGKYGAEWKNLKKELSDFEGIGDTKFAKNESRIKKTVENSISFIQKKFNENKIDISDAIINGAPNFDLLSEMVEDIKDSSAQISLRGIIKDFKKEYDNLIPDDKIRQASKLALKEASDTFGMSMDKLTGYIKVAGKDSKEYIKELKQNIDDFNSKVQEMERANKVSMERGWALKYTKDEIQMNKDYANSLQYVYDILKEIINIEENGGRDKYLQDLRNRINDITNAYKKYIELLKYMGKDKAMENIRTFFPSLDFEPTYDEMVKKLERMLASYKGDADATNIIEQALANIKYDNLKKSLEDNLKKLSAEIKRSETARNFYNEILGMTGDKELAETMTVSIYANIGDEFKERMQKELNGLLDSLKSDTSFSVTPDIENAFKNMDFKTLLALDNLPDEIRKRLQEAYASAQKYERDFITDLVKSYQKARTYEERIQAVRDRESKKREEIDADKAMSPEAKASYKAASEKKEQQEIADIEVERIKNMYVWTKTFEDLGNVSDKTLKQLIANLNLLIEKQGSAMSPEALKAVTQARDKAYDMVGERNPYAGIIKGLRDWGNATKKVNKLRREGKRGTIDELKALDEQKKAWNDAVKSASHLKDGLETLGNAVSALSELFDYDETQGVKYVLDGIAEALTLVGTALVFVNAMMELLASNPLIIGATAIIALITAIVKAIESIKIGKANREIEKQQRLIDSLERSYEQLEEAIKNSFGTEYVYQYNKAIENLYASAEAYRKQAEAERSKGKKANKDTISDYEDKAEEAIKKTSELTKELREFFVGEDLTSAAESFADAWLQAYREFGDTAGAIEERMQEMIDNLIKRSLLSEIAKNVLDKWYQSISDIKVWDAETVAKKWEEAEQLITPMVEGFKIRATQLQEQGKSLRGTAGSFTGIARNIANASEESINGLAAGINTQNYYMQHIDQVVSAILLQLGGKSDVSYEVQKYNPYQQAVLGSLGKLTTIDENIAQILTTLKSVVSTATSAPQNRIYIH